MSLAVLQIAFVIFSLAEYTSHKCSPVAGASTENLSQPAGVMKVPSTNKPYSFRNQIDLLDKFKLDIKFRENL